MKFSGGLFASQGDALEALEPPEGQFDARTRLVEGPGEEGELVLFVGFVRDDGSNAALARRLAGGLASITFIANGVARLNVPARCRAEFRNDARRKPRHPPGRKR